MYHVSAQGLDERMINVHFYYIFFSSFSIKTKSARFELWPVLQGVCEHHHGATRRGILVLSTLQYPSQAGQAQSQAWTQEENSLAASMLRLIIFVVVVVALSFDLV